MAPCGLLLNLHSSHSLKHLLPPPPSSLPSAPPSVLQGFVYNDPQLCQRRGEPQLAAGRVQRGRPRAVLDPAQLLGPGLGRGRLHPPGHLPSARPLGGHHRDGRRGLPGSSTGWSRSEAAPGCPITKPKPQQFQHQAGSSCECPSTRPITVWTLVNESDCYALRTAPLPCFQVSSFKFQVALHRIVRGSLSGRTYGATPSLPCLIQPCALPSPHACLSYIPLPLLASSGAP